MKKIMFSLILSVFFLSNIQTVYAKSCYSDFNCGMGGACVKEPFKNKGVCIKTTNS
jgi:hypothetical protein